MIAGGGTGGHIFPALALAEAFQDRDRHNEILFVGSRRGMESKILAPAGNSWRTIEVSSLKGKSFWGKVRSLMTVPRSLWQSFRLLRSFRPDVVIGVGGYASGPVVLAAWALGIKTAVQEQNAFPGLSNRLLGRFVNRAFISFAGSTRYFPRGKVRLTGNPVRKKIRPGAHPSSGKDAPFTVLIFGGSQGAHPLNRAVTEALQHLQEFRGWLRLIHQTGEADFEEMKRAYQGRGFTAEVYAFIREMDRAYTEADLVLCRAGATTLFELMAMGKPAILVPYPYAADGHQMLNAQTLADAGGALLIPEKELSGEKLAQVLKQLVREPARLREMGRRSAALSKPEAGREIVNLCYEMVGHA